MKRIAMILIGAVLLFALLNPTNQDFKNYTEANHLPQGGRVSYWLVFSYFQVDEVFMHFSGANASGKRHRYLGLFKNFIKLNEEDFNN